MKEIKYEIENADKVVLIHKSTRSEYRIVDTKSVADATGTGEILLYNVRSISIHRAGLNGYRTNDEILEEFYIEI